MDTEDVLIYVFLCVPILICIKDFPDFFIPLCLGLMAAYLLGKDHKEGKI